MDKKNCKGFRCVPIKFAHINMQKCIIWLKKISRGRHGWIKTCVDFWYLLKKTKEFSENKVIFKTITIFKLIVFGL